ncbi:hypothetical protein GOBAR_AA29102 [Gossypium barbadense]|uniref:Uncharacterized protein n=1 Tax=Gossypium barbadense TaxID=3634 RepID=A0A2P5WKH3_GOSBA|nr:hypothetical protein GOBAR_AA29102 [Gossypium barbadense]
MSCGSGSAVVGRPPTFSRWFVGRRRRGGGGAGWRVQWVACVRKGVARACRWVLPCSAISRLGLSIQRKWGKGHRIPLYPMGLKSLSIKGGVITVREVLVTDALPHGYVAINSAPAGYGALLVSLRG